MLEAELQFSENIALSEDEIKKYLQRLKSTKTLKNEDLHKAFNNYSVQRYFKYNMNQFCEFIACVLNEIDSADNLTQFLKNDSIFKKSFLEQDNFHVNFVNYLLPNLIETLSKFSDQQVFEQVSKIVQKCVFNKNFKSFEAYLSGESQNCTLEKLLLCKALFKFLRSSYSLENNAVCIGFKLIFHSFCNSYNNFDLIFKMLLVLVEIIGFDIQNHFQLKTEVKPSETELNVSLRILNDLLQVLTNLKIDSDCKVNEVSFIAFVRILLQSIITLTSEPNEICYDVFLKAIELNPLIIEPIINETIIYIMLSDNNGKSKYEVLLIQIFEIFAKLHRIQNLISKMVPALKCGLESRKIKCENTYKFKGKSAPAIIENLEYNVNSILPQKILQFFANCVTNLASWQVMNLFKTLLYHLNLAVVELSETKQERAQHDYIEILSTLTCCLLGSVRMAEHKVATATVEKFVGGLEELGSILGKFGTTLLQREHENAIVRVFLNVCYNWAECYLSLSYYTMNKEIKMKHKMDNDFSPCNLTYLHPYLKVKEWCLISERITNFGEKPCKEIMQKLFIQKLRASVIFENSMNEDLALPIVKMLSANFEENSKEILTDEFFVSHLLPKLPNSFVLEFSEVLLKTIMDDKIVMTKQKHIFDCVAVVSGLLSVICLKINKLLKQKRKCHDNTVKKAVFSKIMTNLSENLFLDENLGSLLKGSAVILTTREHETHSLDIKINETKLQTYLEMLGKLQILFCSPETQKYFMILLFGLHTDITAGNCDEHVKHTCENLALGIAQHNKFTLVDVFTPKDFLKNVINNFDKSDVIFTYFANNIFKDDAAIVTFRSGIVYIKENIKNAKCLKYALIIMNLVNKLKKSKITVDSKEISAEYKSIICNKIVKIISKEAADVSLIEPFAFVLKTYLSKDENENLAKLKFCLEDYVSLALENLSGDELAGSLLLFTTVLHHKSTLTELKADIVRNIWKSLKTVVITTEILEEYGQLVVLISSLIPNEEFSLIFDDLLNITSFDNNACKEFYPHLKTWTCILSSNFNPMKTKILHDQLELLLHQLILILKRVECQEDLCKEIIQLEVSIIHTNHLSLTSPMLDLFLLSVTILMMKDEGFIQKFSLSASIMENLLKHRNALIMDRLTPYLQQYRLLLKQLCSKSDTNLSLEQRQIQEIGDCAHRLEKLTKNLVACTRDMARIGLYLIADILAEYEQFTLYPNVKIHLNNCIYNLISLCDQHAVQYLMRVLSNASTEIFKMMYENYKKYYRFTGKV